MTSTRNLIGRHLYVVDGDVEAQDAIANEIEAPCSTVSGMESAATPFVTRGSACHIAIIIR
jgi:hypothetical protein